MLDFLMVSTRSPKRGVIEIYPKFITYFKGNPTKKSKDLMIRGGDFYAVWVEERGLWSTDEQDALALIDRELDEFAKKYKETPTGDTIKILYMWDAGNGMIDAWHKYCQKQMRDSFHMLDEKIIFSNDPINKEDFASKRLNYPLESGEITGYDKLMSVLYSDTERHKIEWAIGSIVCGASKTLQKFVVLHGDSGTGKSTVLNIIQKLFDGYYTSFDASALTSSNNSFALEAFRTNPMVAIEHDSDLSRIEDNTKLNSLVSHEEMTVNEKFKSAYTNRFKAFLFMGTNKPVKITDAKSGLLRRLIDVTPTGEKLSIREYNKAVKLVDFELGAIASHCKDVYLADPDFYNDYVPLSMFSATNDFYNFILDSYHIFRNENGTTLKAAWEMYKNYCDDAKVPYPYSQRIFKEELKNYFKEYKERFCLEDGTRVRNYYSDFRYEKFFSNEESKKKTNDEDIPINLDYTESIFDKECKDCYAQYAKKDGTPVKKWENVTTKLSDLDTSKLHYVKVPENHIVIDFDLTDEDGNKDFKQNVKAAGKWPPTYAELSKSGKGIHLHYIYTGDVSKLSRIYDDHIEIKAYTGNGSLRRKLTKCNNLPIAKISSGLPLKGGKMVNLNTVQSEKGLRTLIKRNLRKEIHPATKPSIDFILKILDDAYNSELSYDVTDMRSAVVAFAANSTNHAEYCLDLVNKMRFKSKTASENVENDDTYIIFYDVEVFPNLFIVCCKAEGEGKPIVRMINPKPQEIEELMRFKLVGFNCRRYDNHILYARLIGYTEKQLYDLSRKIVNGQKDCFFGEAYNVSYTDVYDFSTKKQSLKKWEIELGIHHQELGLKWDEPVPENMWKKVAEYCDNDVIATEAVFHACNEDWTVRQILADVAGMSVNNTTNTLTTGIIFGKDREPQKQFNYRFMGANDETAGIENYTVFNEDKKPLFPGYTYENGKSTYRGEEVGEGGYVYAEPGMYQNIALLDIASMHPSSIIAEELFGEKYTARFKEIVDARIAIKHEDFDKAKKMLGGALTEYLTEKNTAKNLAQALKIAINSVYGLTAAKFDNPFRDIRNKDNIVAKRGALFMVNLKHEVQNRGFTVAHIKTDSIKIPNATPEIIQFVMDYGELYGYTFEHEATYDRMCLVNDSVYIAKYKDGDWKAIGKQFAVPYVFKNLFSKKPIVFDDLCETVAVTKGDLYLDMNENLPDVADEEKELSNLESKYKKGLLSDITFEQKCIELSERIKKGHNYIFVGRVGQFCPIKPGCGGGTLCRFSNGKYYAPSGTKGYRWLESEMVKIDRKEGDIDKSYYNRLVDEAVETISNFGDFDSFISGNSVLPDFMNIPDDADEEIPFDPD